MPLKAATPPQMPPPHGLACKPKLKDWSVTDFPPCNQEENFAGIHVRSCTGLLLFLMMCLLDIVTAETLGQLFYRAAGLYKYTSRLCCRGMINSGHC